VPIKLRHTSFALCLVGGLLAAFASDAVAQTPVPGAAGWFHADIGDVGQPGSASRSGATFLVSGAGTDIWGAADSFHFVYTRLDGDGDIYLYAHSETATNPFAKAGVMIRESLDPSSRHVILDAKPDGGIEYMSRQMYGRETSFLRGVSSSFPTWLRLTRRGNAVAAFVSTPSMCGGTECNTWTMVGDGWIEAPAGPSFVGIAVTSHDRSTLNDAVFDFPQVKALAPPWQQQDFYSPPQPDSAWTTQGSNGQLGFFVPAAGSDIWGTADSFKFIWQPLAGDAAIVARVTQVPGSHPFAKGGVMMRDRLSDYARHVILDVKPDGGVEFMARAADGGTTAYIAGGFMPLPAWLKVERHGDQFSGYASSDGSSWVLVGMINLPGMRDSGYLAGVAATSHDPSVPPTTLAMFDNVWVSLSGTWNLLTNGGFEDSTPSALSPPGWVSDSFRQAPARSETAAPHSGAKNGACRTTTSADCGMFQDFTIPMTGNYVFAVYIGADHQGGLVGVNVNGPRISGSVLASIDAGDYKGYAIEFFAAAGDSVRVWVYGPAAAGAIVVDDSTVTRSATQ
jgi:hypothetical protein